MIQCPVCQGEWLPPEANQDRGRLFHADWCPKQLYPKGTRVKFVHTNDPWTRLSEGVLGTVSLVDDFGTVHIDWDDGSHLGLSDRYGDKFEVVA
jgi:hypothetical protein